jgi:aminobenzoyl-glutamate utilization protein B
MYLTSKALKEHMVSAGCGWSMNECILTAGQATADNLPAQIAQIQYIMRVPTIDMAERITGILDSNAAAAATVSHCRWRRDWVSKSRHGLANHALAQATYDNLKLVGAPKFNHGRARQKARLEAMANPFLAETEQLVTPQTAETELRRQLPAWQEHFTSDDYTEYCWHAPTVRLYIARPTLASPQPGYKYPDWAMNALGGIRETIEPMIDCAAKTIGCTIIDLLLEKNLLATARQEFIERTGGGVNGSRWQAPLCDYAAPVNFRWPEYVSTERGHEWWIPG